MIELVTPLTDGAVRSLHAGDEVFLSGKVFTARDEAHLRALELHHQGQSLPFDLEGAAVYHCGPIVSKTGEGWKLVAAGPTTSSRMNEMEPSFIEAFGIRAIIGKGGMSRPTVDAMWEHGCVYLALTGGAAVVASEGISGVKGVDWLDLGMPEAVWELEARTLGPLIVAIDAHGDSLYERIDENVARNVRKIKGDLGL